MEIREYKYFKLWFWGFIILGAILPLIIRVLSEIILTSAGFLEVISSLLYELIAPGHNLLLISVLNDIPFTFLALLSRSRLGKLNDQNLPIHIQDIAGVIGGGIAILAISLFLNTLVWYYLFIDVPVRGISTAPLLFIASPVYGIIAMGIGYFVGEHIGKLILWNRSRKTKEKQI